MVKDYTKRARKVYDEMWAQFDEDCERNWTEACRNLRRSLCQNAGELVPYYTNFKDHMEAVFKVKEQMKSAERPEESSNPVDTMSAWLRGEQELSRIPLEAPRKIQ
jgi:hypothetical protein